MSAGDDTASAGRLLGSLASIDGVQSVTLVGSFAAAASRGSARDIDVVVVCDVLTRELFDHCVAKAAALTGADLGRPGAKVRVNSTFGPLKFDDPDTVVVHLMVYDIASHRTHVLESPFTCFDWERSVLVEGRKLSEIYPVLRLQPRDFFKARRGIEGYLEDIRAGSISYRRYEWSDAGEPIAVVDRASLDERHRGEYAFHIVRNLLGNYAKMLRAANDQFADEELLDVWESEFPSGRALSPRLRAIFSAKRSASAPFPSDAVETTSKFLTVVADELQRSWNDDSARITWVRHAPTALNDGTFLGQRRDPPAELAQIPDGEIKAARSYSSPARRAIDSVSILAPSAAPVIDPHLAEIDYGDAEGLTLEQLGEKYPEMISGWERGGDPAFPGGENLASVRKRIGHFIDGITADPDGPSLVVTHNVVMREILGELFGIPMDARFRIRVPHLEPFSTIAHAGRLYPDISTAQKADLTDTLVSA